MPFIATDLSPDALAQAVEDNYIALFEQFAASLGGIIEKYEGFGRHLTFPAQPGFKGVWRTRLTAGNADAAIAENIAWFKAHRAPFFYWWTHAGTTPEDIGHRLLALGLRASETLDGGLDPALPSIAQGSPVMVADMPAFDESVLTKTPPGFTISRVTTDADLDAFQYVVREVYKAHPAAAQAWTDATRHAGIERAPWRVYLGRLNGEPVATNVVVEGGGIVSVWVVATLPTVRRMGIGAAITMQPLLEWRAMGYRYAALFASTLGAPVYERIGFKRTGTYINRYLWLDDGA